MILMKKCVFFLIICLANIFQLYIFRQNFVAAKTIYVCFKIHSHLLKSTSEREKEREIAVEDRGSLKCQQKRGTGRKQKSFQVAHFVERGRESR